MKIKKAFLVQILGLLINSAYLLVPLGLVDKSAVYFTLFPGTLIFIYGVRMEVKKK